MPDGAGIQGLGGVGAIGPSTLKPVQTAGKGAPSFKDVLFEKIDQVNSLQQEAETAMTNFATGRTQNVSEVLVAVQKADLAFKTLMQIRNKLFEAYQEINQLRI